MHRPIRSRRHGSRSDYGHGVRTHPLWNPFETPSEQEINAARCVHPRTGGDEAGPEWIPRKVSAWDTARKYRRYGHAVDTLYGGGAYMPMADGARYEVWITQSGLVARPANDVARAASAGGWTVAE